MPETKPKVEKVKKATIEDVLISVGSLSELVSKFIDKIDNPEWSRGLLGQHIMTTKDPKIEQEVVRTQPNGLPLPTEYVEIMESVLNKKFDMQVNYMADTSSFELAILVPQEYSNAGKPHWEMYHEDRRSKVIENALGITGVREWMTQIYENFGSETKSKISFDRSQIL